MSKLSVAILAVAILAAGALAGGRYSAVPFNGIGSGPVLVMDRFTGTVRVCLPDGNCSTAQERRELEKSLADLDRALTIEQIKN